ARSSWLMRRTVRHSRSNAPTGGREWNGPACAEDPMLSSAAGKDSRMLLNVAWGKHGPECMRHERANPAWPVDGVGLRVARTALRWRATAARRQRRVLPGR